METVLGRTVELDPASPALVRLQIITPLSILLSLGANLVCALAIKPGLGQISDDYLTILTPRKSLIGIYWLVLYVLQIGYAVLLAVVRKPETRALIINGLGIRFVLANFVFALWAVFWTLRIFLASEICLLVCGVLLLSIWLTLLRWNTTISKRPLDYILINMPVVMFLLVLWNVDIWQNGLLAFHWFKYVGSDPNEGPGKWEKERGKHAWIIFGIVTAVGLINSFIVFIGRDLVWALASIYLYIALLLKEPKPPQVVISLILVSALQLIAFVASALWYRYKAKQDEGRILLPADDLVEDDAARAGFVSNLEED
ncbi:uncharacterized protein L969DRAFT_58006 [Mixia osmundae IAM 14324]|uniref:Uncharacterized protein n=1 Tax=Mixia osmundae (strain CBS 9802 / IAM 14324 / JCM 22182 / KY 12970) TaxID=764103 RepID=G7DXP3_MIXOS|nr:uncharacterized protein L969DRAFT_58006 [Mixia osmundae IAM 14324]KEI41156.1 hypothetical protein L969DRAFT_58006 [Mixia osmundae IAM 14324]GAA95353.1 hypothetical protein E5Q_02010 [Mixia osmundae IAM 14324]